MRTTKNQSFVTVRLLACILASVFTLCSAVGQSNARRFAIPYEFSIGTKVLAAGTYTFSVNQSFLVVQSHDGERYSAVINARIGEPSSLLRDGSLVFEKTGDERILAEVWMPGADGLRIHKIVEDHNRDVLMVSDLDEHKVVSGKFAYNATCGKCHGADGNGEARADKFFKITIPRLTSDKVQSKTDAEIKELINNGNSVMPPVEVEEAGFQHRLPQQDVDAVIAYVRTLK
jgi:cytochrome c553